MKYKPGDKVSFLNEKGQGTVTRAFADGMVYVAVEDGFEIPYPESDLVYSNPPEPPATGGPIEENLNKVERISSPSLPNNLLLIFVSEGELFSGVLQVYLLNRTAYDLLYTLSFSEKEAYQLYSLGSLKQGEQEFIETVEWSHLNKFSNLCVNAIYYKEEDTYEAKSPVNEILKINPIKFFREAQFKQLPSLPGKAFVIELIKSKSSANISIDPIAEMKAFLESDKPSKNIFSKPKADKSLMEVDLHIAELVDDYKNLTNSQMLAIQLSHFQQKLEEAILMKAKKIVFIHGVGAGVLKTEVRKILSNYEGLRFHDASYSKYGVGATEVVIH